MSKPKILLMGCGGIGGVMAAALLEHGEDLRIVTHNSAIADAINECGLQVHENGVDRVVPAWATAGIPDHAGPFDFVLLATPPQNVEDAAQAALPYLGLGGAMVCFQNGLCEPRVAAIATVKHTLGAIVAWGGSMPSPGVYERTSEGGFTIGCFGSAPDARLQELQRVLEIIGPVEITENLGGARWSKLAINCAISPLGAIGGDRLGPLLRQRFVRRLGLEVMTEVVMVARSRGVRLEKVAGTIDLDWVALTESEYRSSGSPSLLAKHALLLAVGARFRRLRSSMLAAIERGKDPGIDYINGEVVWRAAELGASVPVNERIVETVYALSKGEMQPGLPCLAQLYAETRVAESPLFPSDRFQRDDDWMASSLRH